MNAMAKATNDIDYSCNIKALSKTCLINHMASISHYVHHDTSY